MPNVLMISSGLFHPPLLGRRHLRRDLSAIPGIRLYGATTVEGLPQLRQTSLDALVLYFHRRRASSAALEALDLLVRGGCGVLAVHSATASFKQFPSYGDILGCHFTGHPPAGELQVRQTGASNIFGAVAPFSVHDEVYRHMLSPDIQVHFTARSGAAGETLPFVWTRRHGAGRICYVGAGHRAGSFQHASITHILRAGLSWVCRRDEEAAS
jgi:type 1 glutamine amidotransferase